MTIRNRSLATITAALLVFAPAFASGVITQKTNGLDIRTGVASLDDAGSVAIGTSNADIGGQNPGLLPSIYSWDAASGAATLLWSFPSGVRTSDSAVSDDGAWVAFLTREDLTGGNPSGAEQLFLRRTDGSETRQLTSMTPGDGSIPDYALAGSGNRVVFTASTDPLGTNPAHCTVLFVVDTDGTNLRQLTTAPTVAYPFHFSISDDGTRIAFTHTGDLTGGNPDGSNEIFAIDADGTNLRQLTSGPYANPTNTSDARLSGDGGRIAFFSTADYGGQNPSHSWKIWVIDWSGSGLTALPMLDGDDPAITDDGQFIVYTGYDIGGYAISRVRYDGTGTARLTLLPVNDTCNQIQVSGDGSRVTFDTYDETTLPNHGGNPTKVMDGTGSNLLQLGADDIEEIVDPELTADGTRLVFASSANPFGTNPNRRVQLFRMQTDGSGLVQITALTDGDAWKPSVSDDGQKITFLSNANPLGNNSNHNLLPFAIRADGTQLTLLEASAGAVIAPTISGNGNWVVYQSVAVGHVAQLVRMSSTGTSPLYITNDGDQYYKHPRVDANGIYVVYSTNSGIWRVTTNNTARQQLTTYFARYPDVSGNGTRYVWVAQADPLGTNPDGSDEIFSWDAPTNTYRQLTSLPAGTYLGRIRISRDGAYVTFYTDSAYRLQVATGTVERIGGMGAALFDGGNKLGDFISISSNGSKMAFVSESNSAGNNADGSSELFLVEMARTPQIRVSATSPTIVSWDADPHALMYDAVRGDTANLAIAGSTVDLGPVSCLGDDMKATNTSPDAGEPTPGQAFFYLVRESSGPLLTPGSYGQGSSARERVTGAGGCP